jgi:hypothetical protein
MVVLKKPQQPREDLACEQAEESKKAITSLKKENPEIGEPEKIPSP